MKFAVEEYLRADRISHTEIDYTYDDEPITLGRSLTSTYKIGEGLGEWAMGVSNTQCTISSEEGTIFLKDGGDKPSANGIYLHGERIEKIPLDKPLELTLYKKGGAKVSFFVKESFEIKDGNSGDKETFSGDSLMGILQDQIRLLQEQVVKLGEQLLLREATDRAQSISILNLKKQIKKVLSIVMFVTAFAIFSSGVVQEVTSEEKKEYTALVIEVVKNILISGAIGGGAVVISKRE